MQLALDLLATRNSGQELAILVSTELEQLREVGTRKCRLPTAVPSAKSQVSGSASACAKIVSRALAVKGLIKATSQRALAKIPQFRMRFK